MAVLPSLNTISGFVINLLYNSWNYIIPCKICYKGEAIIKKRLGKPVFATEETGLYWKIPLIEDFDTVNIKKQTLYLYAHSILLNDEKYKYIPTNIVIDAQIEYKIIEPTCIYSITEESISTFVENKVHEIIGEIVQNSKDLTNNINTILNNIDKKTKTNGMIGCNVPIVDDSKNSKTKNILIPFIIVNTLLLYPLFLYFNVGFVVEKLVLLYISIAYIWFVIFINKILLKKDESKNNNILYKNAIKIENIIVTSFDYNVSLRTTQ